MGCVTLLLLGVARAVLAVPSAGEVPPVDDVKIIGGHTSHVDDAPFMVQVLWKDPKTSTSEYTACGATLLSDRHALTAGHCVPEQNNPTTTAGFTIVYGASEFNAKGKNGAKVQAAAFQRHPKYVYLEVDKAESAHYDVAVIRLKQPVKLGPKVGTLKITAPNAEPKAGSQLSVSGWGVYKAKPVPGSPGNYSLEASRKLRTGSYKVTPRATCLKELGPKLFTKQDICVEEKKTSAYCLGDSGGPGYQGRTQYSVVSSGGCGLSKPLYSVMANLADPEINKFIQDQLKIK